MYWSNDSGSLNVKGERGLKMLNVDILFKIGAMGILLIVLDKVLESSGKKDIAVITNIAGVVIILLTVIGLVANLFDTVKTMFML